MLDRSSLGPCPPPPLPPPLLPALVSRPRLNPIPGSANHIFPPGGVALPGGLQENKRPLQVRKQRGWRGV